MRWLAEDPSDLAIPVWGSVWVGIPDEMNEASRSFGFLETLKTLSQDFLKHDA